jgi:hypothetical protein
VRKIGMVVLWMLLMLGVVNAQSVDPPAKTSYYSVGKTLNVGGTMMSTLDWSALDQMNQGYVHPILSAIVIRCGVDTAQRESFRDQMYKSWLAARSELNNGIFILVCLKNGKIYAVSGKDIRDKLSSDAANAAYTQGAAKYLAGNAQQLNIGFVSGAQAVRDLLPEKPGGGLGWLWWLLLLPVGGLIAFWSYVRRTQREVEEKTYRGPPPSSTGNSYRRPEWDGDDARRVGTAVGVVNQQSSPDASYTGPSSMDAVQDAYRRREQQGDPPLAPMPSIDPWDTLPPDRSSRPTRAPDPEPTRPEPEHRSRDDSGFGGDNTQDDRGGFGSDKDVSTSAPEPERVSYEPSTPSAPDPAPDTGGFGSDNSSTDTGGFGSDPSS